MGRRKKPSPEKEEPGCEVVALLRAQLEASELRHRVNELQSVVTSLEAELKESNSLLLKSRNIQRPFTNSVEKQLIAARQNWRCASGDACPLRTLTPNQTFDASLWCDAGGKSLCSGQLSTLAFTNKNGRKTLLIRPRALCPIRECS